MSTTTKNVGRVSIVPKGDWNINNTYIRLDLVTYNGNSYIAKKDVPKNIQLSNNNYWMLIASKGEQGERGEQGAPFAIVKSYASIAAMNADFSNTDVQNGQFVVIDTGNVQDSDNAKLYYKGSSNYVFVTDMSGTAGIQGPRGASAYEQAVAGGYEGTEAQFNEDLADFKELSEQAASSAIAADNSAKDAEAYAIGKRGDTDVESTDPTYHNNAKYYSEQAALIVDDVEQVMTSTTIGPTAFATFDASVASMPLKGLTADIEPVQNFNGYSRPWLGGAGKNQLSLSMSFLYEKNTSGTWTNNSYALNGVTFEVQLNNDNDVIGINVNGTASTNTNFLFIERAPISISGYPLIENGCPSGGSNNTYSITTRVYHSDFGFTDYYDYGSGLKIPSGEMFKSFSSQIRIHSGYTASNLIFRPMIRFEFSDDGETFEPYSNICPITGQTGCNVTRTGKNLFNESLAKWKNNVLINSSGVEVSNAGYKTTGYYSQIAPGSYAFQYNKGDTVSAPAIIAYYDKNKTFISRTYAVDVVSGSGIKTGLVTVPDNTCFYRLSLLKNYSTNVQVELGSTATAYEPYQGNTYDITFPSSAGTVYGGTLDVVNKQLIVTKKYALLNDPDKWSKTKFNIFQYSDQFSDRKRYRTFLEGFLCSCANTSSSQVLQARWAGVNTDYFCFSQFSPGNDDILDKIKTAAANNKIAILYDLAEPLVYDITTEQVTTLLGEDNIWADTGDVTVTYGAYLETIKTYADQAVDSAAAAETAQSAAEDAQAAAEAVLASIPEDYTALSGDVDNLKSATIGGELNKIVVKNEYVNNAGAINPYNGWDRTDYVLVAGWRKLKVTASSASNYNVFYDINKNFIYATVTDRTINIVSGENEVLVPPNAYYAIFSGTAAYTEALKIEAIERYADYRDNKLLQYDRDLLNGKQVFVVGPNDLTIGYSIDTDGTVMESARRAMFSEYYRILRPQNKYLITCPGFRVLICEYTAENGEYVFLKRSQLANGSAFWATTRTTHIRFALETVNSNTIEPIVVSEFCNVFSMRELNDINTYLRVCTFNQAQGYERFAHANLTNATKRKINFLNFIGEYNPDILCAQEALGDYFCPDEEKLPVNNVFNRKYLFTRQSGYQRRTWSKYNYKEPETITFTHQATGGTRFYGKETYLIEGKEIVVLNTHCEYQGNSDFDLARKGQFEELVAEMQQHTYCICCGDFNAWSADEFNVFTNAGLSCSNCGDYGEIDTWYVGMDYPDWPFKAVDNIITTPSIVIQNVVRGPYDFDYFSDHAPLIADLQIR